MTRARSLSQLANSNVFSVDANNSRVGIGSTVPTVKLDVGGDINVSGTLTYEDVTNVETTGIVTAAQLVVTGVGATGAAAATGTCITGAGCAIACGATGWTEAVGAMPGAEPMI